MTGTVTHWHGTVQVSDFELNLKQAQLKVLRLPTNCHVSPSESSSSVTARPQVTVPVVPDSVTPACAGESARPVGREGPGRRPGPRGSHGVNRTVLSLSRSLRVQVVAGGPSGPAAGTR